MNRIKKMSKKKLLTLLIAAIAVACIVGLFTYYAKPMTTDTTGYVGLTREEAINKAEDKGQRYRIVADDQNPDPISITDDYRPDRINFEIKNNKVIRAEFY